MKTYKFDGYKLILKDTKNRDSHGKAIVEYTFKDPENKVIFSGNDFYPSPMYKPESKDSAIALLGFLTCKPGDTDDEYFKDYTQDQLNWCNSQDCENLSIVVMDYEDRQQIKQLRNRYNNFPL